MRDRILGMRRGFVVFVAIGLYTIGPILCVVAASLLAGALNCRLDESGVHPCLCMGVDIGGLLYPLFVMGWLALITFPTGPLAMFAFLIVTVASKWRG
jgi:hypothetical protein